MRLRDRGLTFTPRSEQDVEPDALRRTDLCWAAAHGLTGVRPERVPLFALQHLLYALDTGEPRRIARGLGLFVLNFSGVRRRGSQLIAACVDIIARIAQRSATPYLRAWAALARAGALYFNEGRTATAIPLLEEAQGLFRNQVVGAHREYLTTLGLHAQTLLYADRPHRFRELHRDWIRLNERTGDPLMALVRHRFGAIHLLDDHPDQTDSEAANVDPRWTATRYLALRNQLLADLYRGGSAAWRRLATTGRGLTHATIGQHMRWETLAIRARAAIAALSDPTLSQVELQSAVQTAQQDAAAIEELDRGMVAPYAPIVRAALALHENNIQGALEELDEATHRCQQHDPNTLLAACIKRRQGQLLSTEQGLELITEADELIHTQGVTHPPHWTRLHLPGRYP